MLAMRGKSSGFCKNAAFRKHQITKSHAASNADPEIMHQSDHRVGQFHPNLGVWHFHLYLLDVYGKFVRKLKFKGRRAR